MIFLKFKKGQGLGNQLWNYIVLRSVADFNNFKYEIINFSSFIGKDFLKIEEKNTSEELSKESLFLYKEPVIYDNDLKCYVNVFDKNIFEIKKHTLIEGILQSEQYLKPDLNIINKYIKLKDQTINKSITNKTCIINLRGGEYKLHKNLILPKSYWINAIKNMKRYRHDLIFKIITDDYDYASALLPEYEIIKGTIAEDFKNLYSSKYVILSNSSFGYFPIKMGNPPDIVIGPNHWARYGNKYNRWASPTNFYKGWLWQNVRGEIIKESEIENSINESYSIYSTYNVSTCEAALSKFSIKQILPLTIKKLIKKILSKIFPLHIG